jgi:hypothetical protein
VTPKEELIQAIERSPDEIVRSLLDALHALQRNPSTEATQTAQGKRMFRKQGVLVVEAGESSGLDISTFISEMREERIQSQLKEIGL